METDKSVSEYMNRRNILAENVARILSAQILIVALFFCAYVFLQNTNSPDLNRLRIIVKGVLIVFSLLIGLCSVIVMNHIGDVTGNTPDDIGLRSSHEIVDYAYEIADGALHFRMTVSGIMLTGGVLASIIVMAIKGLDENGTLIAKVVFFFFLAIAVYIFIPSFDRMRVYKGILDGSITRSSLVKGRAEEIRRVGISFFVIMPASVCIYLLWRYFGNNRSIAWTIFVIAGLLFGTLTALRRGHQNNL